MTGGGEAGKPSSSAAGLYLPVQPLHVCTVTIIPS